jgi:hypothetical protein
MSFRMSSDDTVTCVSGEGPRPSPGGIAGHTNADQTSEGPSLERFLTYSMFLLLFFFSVKFFESCETTDNF